MEKVNQHITVYGRVQGVGFRAFVQRLANKLALTGYARNQVDGTVFVVVEGEKHAVENFVNQCKIGPGWSHVDQVKSEEFPVQEFKEFRIKY